MSDRKMAVHKMAKSCLKKLLDDDVIEQTIIVMRDLRESLEAIEHVRDQPELATLLLRLSSESIREALHKNELPITNSIIRSKNRIFEASGITRPEDHEEIDLNKFGRYHW